LTHVKHPSLLILKKNKATSPFVFRAIRGAQCLLHYLGLIALSRSAPCPLPPPWLSVDSICGETFLEEGSPRTLSKNFCASLGASARVAFPTYYLLATVCCLFLRPPSAPRRVPAPTHYLLAQHAPPPRPRVQNTGLCKGGGAAYECGQGTRSVAERSGDVTHGVMIRPVTHG